MTATAVILAAVMLLATAVTIVSVLEGPARTWSDDPVGTVTGKRFAYDYDTPDPWDGTFVITVESDDDFLLTTDLRPRARQTVDVDVPRNVWLSVGLGSRWGE